MATPFPQFTTPPRPLTWLITGCSSGLGLALARRAQAAGHHVIATSRDPARTLDLVREIQGGGGEWIRLDVDDPGCGRVIDELEEEQGGRPIDVLVNNAGYAVIAAAECLTEDEVRRQMETVYFGPFRLIRAAVPHMRRRRFGVVVNISSGAGLEGREGQAAYASAKAAMDGVVKVLAKEVAPFNIRTLTVHLGAFNTNMTSAIAAAAASQQSTPPLPDDYRGTVLEKTVQVMASGDYALPNDKDKGAARIFDVVMGRGEAGRGREGELLLPLGVDMPDRVRLVRDRLDRCLEVFGDVCRSVAVDQ